MVQAQDSTRGTQHTNLKNSNRKYTTRVQVAVNTRIQLPTRGKIEIHTKLTNLRKKYSIFLEKIE